MPRDGISKTRVRRPPLGDRIDVPQERLDRVTFVPGAGGQSKEGCHHTSTAAVLENLPRIARVETS